MAKSRRNAIVHEIQALRDSLSALDSVLRRLVPLLTAAMRNGAKTENPRPRRISAEGRAGLRLHGKYIGHLRHLKPRQKAEVRKIKEAKGVRAAISFARRLAA